MLNSLREKIWQITRRSSGAGVGIDAAVFVAALALYWLTLSPGLLPADAGEFQLVAAKLGVAHPPGYPLYTMLAWLFTLLTPHNPAYGVNLFSAVTAALAVMLTGRAARRWSGSAWGGLAAALLLAIAASFWSTATQASIRPLTAFFTALMLERLAVWSAMPGRIPIRPYGVDRGRELAAFALAVGLGIAHHPSLVFLVPIFALYIVLTDASIVREPRRWLMPIAAIVLGFVPWLYLPVRGAMQAPLAPADLATWGGFWNHVLARGFSGDFFSFHTPTELADRFAIWLNILRLQWGTVIPVAGVIGGGLLAWHNWRLALMLVAAFVLHSFISMTYRAPQTVEYLIPAYVLLAVMVGAGLGSGIVSPQRTQKLQNYSAALRAVSIAALAIVLVAGIVHAATQYPSFAWLAQDDSTRETAESLLRDAPLDAVILASWHWSTPMLALQAIEGTRLDVEVFYVYPDGAEALADTWVRRIDANIKQRPVIVTSFYPPEFAAAPYFYEPIDGGWLVRTAPRRDVPDGFEALDFPFNSGVTLIGVDESKVSGQVGDVFSVRLAWRVDAAQTQDITGFVHFVNSAGTVITSSDRPLPTSRAQVGDILIDEYTVGMPPWGLPTPQDTYRLEAGLYSVGGDGSLVQYTHQDAARMFVAGVNVQPATWPALLEYPDDQVVPLGGEMVLTRVEVTPGGPLHPGDEVIIDLTFLASKPILSDYVVKVDLIGQDYAWRVPSDHIPATGAIPTLKWLYGWEVHDRHRFIVPDDASTTTAHAEIVVYDHFTGQVLAILDPARAQQGIAVKIWEWPTP